MPNNELGGGGLPRRAAPMAWDVKRLCSMVPGSPSFSTWYQVGPCAEKERGVGNSNNARQAGNACQGQEKMIPLLLPPDVLKHYLSMLFRKFPIFSQAPVKKNIQCKYPVIFSERNTIIPFNTPPSPAVAFVFQTTGL